LLTAIARRKSASASRGPVLLSANHAEQIKSIRFPRFALEHQVELGFRLIEVSSSN
jgi:hypothetical protein